MSLVFLSMKIKINRFPFISQSIPIEIRPPQKCNEIINRKPAERSVADKRARRGKKYDGSGGVSDWGRVTWVILEVRYSFRPFREFKMTSQVRGESRIRIAEAIKSNLARVWFIIRDLMAWMAEKLINKPKELKRPILQIIRYTGTDHKFVTKDDNVDDYIITMSLKHIYIVYSYTFIAPTHAQVLILSENWTVLM